MCGIAGFWSATSLAEEQARQHLEQMTATLVHRGPDASGILFDGDSGIGFGHRRLSILDLSEAGQQPMWSRSGRYCIVYNGEVYNAPEIRASLEQRGLRIEWRGHSDTEIVLETIEVMGLRAALEQFRGMFAFALWDDQRKHLSLARDRLGIKPLLYVTGRFGIGFASELQALFELPAFRPHLNRTTVASFLRYGVVPDDECIVEDVRKLPPGALVQFDSPGAGGDQDHFWDARDVVPDCLANPFSGTEQDAVDELERLLQESVAMRMRSDVPFGAFLSGGIDSSAIVALMQKASSKPVQTFCIGNSNSGYDEADDARAIADHLHCEHHTLVAEPQDMLDVVLEVADYWDEPFADSSQIPTLLVSRLTRSHVTVALSGDGGDELFAGYNRHVWAPRLWKFAQRMPRSARKAFGALRRVEVDRWDGMFRAIGLGNAIRLPGDKLHKMAHLADVDSPQEFYQRLRSQWSDPASVMAKGTGIGTPPGAAPFDLPFAEQMMFYDMTQYLPGDILTKVDRASMSVSLETRVPLLDHKVVEFAWRLPLVHKIRGRTQKHVLREVLGRSVPPNLFDRPKMGFGVPTGQWLRGPLKDWAADMLDGKRLAEDGILDPRTVTETWNAHQAGRGNHEHQLWAVLMFQAWWNRNRHRVSA